MEYKGYLARVHFDTVTQIWEGEVVGLSSVKFQSRNMEGVEIAFHEAVEHYLERRASGSQLLNKLYSVSEIEKTSDSL